MKKLILLLVMTLIFKTLNCIKIDRVILATDTNEMYMDFWPLVAKAWKNLIGIKPTLAFIATKDVKVDETVGDVIRFEPIKGIPTSQQAQVIRLLLPAYFEDEVCIISDIDMIPISKEFFIDTVIKYPEDSFLVYRDNAYKGKRRFPMCYVAAKGKIFKEIFSINNKNDIPKIIRKWNKFGYGWHTDEIVLYNRLIKWPLFKEKCIKLGRSEINRIDRANWSYEKELLQKNHYVDAHLLRPYKKYKIEIDKLANDLELK